MENEVRSLSTNLKTSSVEKIYAITGDLNAYFILSQWNPGWKSLDEMIQEEPQMSLGSKLKLMRLVATSMLELVSSEVKFHHGHLHPGNILVENFHAGRCF